MRERQKTVRRIEEEIVKQRERESERERQREIES